MNDQQIQDWLDGVITERPDTDALQGYQRLYSALGETPRKKLSEGFAESVAARISRIEIVPIQDKLWGALTIFCLIAVAIWALIYTAQFIEVELFSVPSGLAVLTILQDFVSQVWIYTGLICVVIAGLDSFIIQRQRQSI